MCNINLIMRKDGAESKDINSLMNIISWFSWKGNRDGEGYIARDKQNYYTRRSIKKIDFTHLKPCNMIVSHQRFTTSGKGFNNTHPHESKNFILQHNGIFAGLGNNKVSDTKMYLDRLQKKYDTLKDVVKSIQETNKETGGYYSIILYDKEQDKLYYYKDDRASMYMCNSKEYLFMSTSEQNVHTCMEYFNINKNKIVAVTPFVIYEIVSNGLKKIDTFEPFREPVTKQKTFSGWSGDYNERRANKFAEILEMRKYQDEAEEEMYDISYENYKLDCEVNGVEPMTLEEFKKISEDDKEED